MYIHVYKRFGHYYVLQKHGTLFWVKISHRFSADSKNRANLRNFIQLYIFSLAYKYNWRIFSCFCFNSWVILANSVPFKKQAVSLDSIYTYASLLLFCLRYVQVYKNTIWRWMPPTPGRRSKTHVINAICDTYINPYSSNLKVSLNDDHTISLLHVGYMYSASQKKREPMH